MIRQRRALLAMAAAASSVALGRAARAADFPDKPVNVIVGYAAGGPTDVLVRAMGPLLTADWKQPVVVENRPGANETIAAQLVARAKPDGHTLLLCTETPLTQAQFLYSKLPYDPEKDFAPVTRMLFSPMALVVPASLPVDTIEELIALARTRASSKPLLYGSAGAGGVLHLPMAMLAKQNNLTMDHVPYKGVAPLLTDLVAGQIDVGIFAVAGAAPYVKDGRLKALVVSAPQRVKSMPQVPIFAETQVAPVQADFSFALVAPAGTPEAARERIAASVRRVLDNPKFRETYIDPYGYVTVGSTPGELERFLVKDRPLQAERIRVSGARLD